MIVRKKSLRAASMSVLAGVAIWACDDGSGVGDASVRVLLTDAPSDYIAAAFVDIGAIELIPAGDGERIVLSEDGTDGLVDLLELRNRATVAIAEADIEPGDYSQLRLIVEDARVELAAGYEFNDGTTEKDLFVPSGAQTGIKLNLAAGDDGDGEGPVTIAPGETVLVLDFDVNQSFVIQGNPETPAGINGILFKPTIRVIVEDVAATVSGTVTTELAEVSLEGLVVTAEPEDEGTVEEYQTQTATTVTQVDGSYTLHFLVPGTYAVTVETPSGLTTVPLSRSVELTDGEVELDVDFEMVEGGS